MWYIVLEAVNDAVDSLKDPWPIIIVDKLGRSRIQCVIC